MQAIQYVKKRDQRQVKFDPEKIKNALRKAFNAQGIDDEYIFKNLTQEVMSILDFKYGEGRTPSVEDIQDIVEIILIKNNYTKIAKAYMLYREQHKQLRQEKVLEDIKEYKLQVQKTDGQLAFFNPDSIKDELEKISEGLTKINIQEIIDEVCKTVYNGILETELHNLVRNAARTNIEKHYEYSLLSARIVLNKLYDDILQTTFYAENLKEKYQEHFNAYLEQGISIGMLTPQLREYDLIRIGQALAPERDKLFYFLGVQTIYDRYLIRTREDPQEVFELPQYMWMRIAMGLAMNEEHKEERAIEFYNVLSNFYALSSTPTLFNSGTMHPQMSSCFLNTTEDSLNGIFKIFADNAALCKFAGAVGTDWTFVRSKNALIRGTNGKSQGIIPFIKIFNDVALAVNQGGKRTGQLAAYLEVWHRDIDEFTELKKNTGDERRRAHDIHPAVFIPDLFMKRVQDKKNWTLFSPNTVPELHDAYGKKFEELYEQYEQQDIPGKKVIPAAELWKKILTMLYETGHPWITFKDPMNVRSPQDHAGVIHASNLCTEITLNTSKEETAVCNLASVNLARMIKNNAIDEPLLAQTVASVIRMLDNVVTNNLYTIPETRTSNMRHRPIGMGIMGYHDALYQLSIDFDSEENIEFADASMEMVSYYAILASAHLAQERGAYLSYKGSKWDRGIFPYDTLSMLEQERGRALSVDKKIRLDWAIVKEAVKQHGMRNSNCMAIAPTATIANISGVVPCVEPIFKNLYMKENMGGNFIVINTHLIDALEQEGIWNEDTLTKIKLNNGSILNIDEIPPAIRRRFKEVFEIDPVWIIKAAARRAKWIDQAASTNLFVKTNNGKAISDLYMLAWEEGLKTTYYLRTLSSSQVTKTVSENTIPKEKTKEEELKVCMIDDPSCEACQ